MTKYSVLLFYPSHICENGPETYYAHVEAKTAKSAVRKAQAEAATENDYEGPASDFKPDLVLLGHHFGLEIK